MDHTLRLLAAIQAAVPGVTGIRIGIVGNSATVQVEPANQQAAAQTTINAFDWSEAAQTAYDNLEARVLAKLISTTLKSADGKVLRALAAVICDEINIVRAALPTPLAARTLAQLKTAIGNKLDAGTVD